MDESNLLMFGLFSIIVVLSVISVFSNIMVSKFNKGCNFLETKFLEMSVIILIFISYININMMVSGKILSPVYLLCIFIYVFVNYKKVEAKSCFEIAIPLLVIFYIINIILDVSSSWVVEGHNHDLIYYYHMALNAFKYSIFNTPLDLNYPTISVSEFQGNEALLVRQGGSELFGLYSFFFYTKSPNTIYLQYLIIVLLLSRLSYVIYRGDKLLTRILITSLLSLSTGYLNALVNSNIPTFLGASLLVLTFAICLAKDRISIQIRYLSVTLCLSLSTLCYGEMLFYCGFIIFIYFCFDLFFVKPGVLLKLIGFYGIIFIFLTNVTILVTLNSVLLLNKAVNDGGGAIANMPPLLHWAYYIFYNPLNGYHIKFHKILITFSYFALLITFLLNLNFKEAAAKVSIVLITLALILTVYFNGYTYGVHKTYQILSPLWFFFLIYSLFSISSKKNHFLLLVPLVIVFLHVGAYKNYIDNARSIHVIKDDLSSFTKLSPSGSNVAIDQYDMNNISGFQKSNYLALSIYDNGGFPSIGDFIDFPLKGGYFHKELSKPLDINKLNYLISMQPEYSRGYIKKAALKHIAKKNNDFTLYKVDKNFNYIYILSGIYDYEINYVFSNGQLVLKPIILGGVANLNLTLTPFNLSNPSLVNVYVDNVLINTYDALPNKKINIDLQLLSGVENISIKAQWSSQSPKELGINGDGRKLSFQIDKLIFE